MARALSCSLLALLLFGYLARSWNLAITPELSLLTGGLLFLELLAVPQKDFGLFSTSFSLSLASALSPSLGPSATAVSLLGVLIFRTLTKGAIGETTEDWQARWRELIVDLLSQLSALAFLLIGGTQSPASWMLAITIYWPLSLLLPPWLAAELPYIKPIQWREVLWLTGPLRLALGFLGVALALLHHQMGGLAWWLLPVLLILQRCARTEAIRLEILDAERAQAEEEKARLSLALADAQLLQTRKELQIKAEEVLFLEQCARALSQSPSLEAALEVIAQTWRRLTQSSSLVIWLPQGPNLVAAVAAGPLAQDLAALDSSRLRSYLEAGTLSAVQWEKESGWVGSLEGQGVIYFSQTNMTAEAWGQVRLLTGQAGLSIQSARYQQAQQSAIQQLMVANEQLNTWLDRLLLLLDGARSLSATLETSVLLERFGQLLQSLAPAGLVLRSDLVENRWGDLDEASCRDWIGEMPEDRVLETREQAGQQRMLVRLADEEGAWGWLVLKGPADFFSPGMQRVVQVLCYHLGSALRGADYHAQVQQTLTELRETQAQLIQSSKMAAMGQFAAGMAHEINSPLAAIAVALESAEAKLNDPETAKKRLGLARKGVDKATAILRKLLYYSREGAEGKQRAALLELVQDTLDIFGPQMEKSGLEIELVAESEPWVCVNLNEVQQIFVNLLLNARDATAQSEHPKVTIRVSSQGSLAMVEMSDNGSGIPPEVQARIFEPFFTTKPLGEGTGLGLSVSYQIAQNHEGEILVARSDEHGTVFQVRLPLDHS